MKKRSVRIIAFICGFVGNLFGLMGPIHEFFHWITLRLAGHAAQMTWGMTYFNKPTLLSAVAGPFGEVVVMYTMAIFLAAKRKFGAFLFFMGAANAAFVLGFFATDFTVWVRFLAGPMALAFTFIAWIGLNGTMSGISWSLFSFMRKA